MKGLKVYSVLMGKPLLINLGLSKPLALKAAVVWAVNGPRSRYQSASLSGRPVRAYVNGVYL